MANGDVTPKQLIEAAESCAASGVALGVWTETLDGAASFSVNVRGLVSDEDLRVRSSDLSIRNRIADFPLQAWSVTPDRRGAAVIARRPASGECFFETGEPDELLTARLIEVTRQVFSSDQPDPRTRAA